MVVIDTGFDKLREEYALKAQQTVTIHELVVRPVARSLGRIAGEMTRSNQGMTSWQAAETVAYRGILWALDKDMSDLAHLLETGQKVEIQEESNVSAVHEVFGRPVARSMGHMVREMTRSQHMTPELAAERAAYIGILWALSQDVSVLEFLLESGQQAEIEGGSNG